MFDISKEKIDVKCKCGRSHKATLQEVANGKIIHCFCGTDIKLQDNGTVAPGIRQANKAMQDLENAFKKLGRR